MNTNPWTHQIFTFGCTAAVLKGLDFEKFLFSHSLSKSNGFTWLSGLHIIRHETFESRYIPFLERHQNKNEFRWVPLKNGSIEVEKGHESMLFVRCEHTFHRRSKHCKNDSCPIGLFASTIKHIESHLNHSRTKRSHLSSKLGLNEQSNKKATMKLSLVGPVRALIFRDQFGHLFSFVSVD